MAGRGNKVQSDNEKLRDTQRMLEGVKENMKLGNESVDRTAGNLQDANSKFGQYDPKIKKTQLLVQEIQKKEMWDEMKLKYSYWTFVGSAAYLCAKRFFLWEIIYLLAYVAYFVLSCAQTTLTSLINNTPSLYVSNQQTRLIDYLLQIGSYDNMEWGYEFLY